MESALIGTLGVLIGILFTEFFRRKNRIENYTQKIFEKRLEILEELYRLVTRCGEVGGEVIKNANLSQEERYETVNSTIIEMTEWCDHNGLYLEEEVSIHCMTILLGAEEIWDIDEESEKTRRVENFYAQLRYAKEIIKKESGISDINKSFTSMTKAKYSSPIIEYYRLQKKAMLKSSKKKASP